MYTISERCFLVLVSGLRIEDSSRQIMIWPQLMQDAGFEEKRASSVYKGILDLISLTRLGTHTHIIHMCPYMFVHLYIAFLHTW